MLRDLISSVEDILLGVGYSYLGLVGAPLKQRHKGKGNSCHVNVQGGGSLCDDLGE